MNAHRRIVLVDFDGVVHLYSKGWKGPLEIYDVPVPGAFDFLYKAIDSPKIDPQIYSSRSKLVGGIDAMKGWFLRHDFDPGKLSQLKFPVEKPPAWLTIDDRAFRFRGVFPSEAEILEFQSWIQSR